MVTYFEEKVAPPRRQDSVEKKIFSMEPDVEGRPGLRKGPPPDQSGWMAQAEGGVMDVGDHLERGAAFHTHPLTELDPSRQSEVVAPRDRARGGEVDA